MFQKNNLKKGFTIVELLVSIAIIGLLSAVTFSSFAQSQERARVSKRVTDIKNIQNALEFYYAVSKSYPTTSGFWRSECSAWGGYAPSAVIPGLVPNYMSNMPSDPGMDKAANTSCYLYASDGVNYALLDHDVADLRTSPFTYSTYPELVDPARDGGSNASIVDGAGIWSWKIYRGAGVTW
ncbi:MAG: prepilin-type N-terminal cleavage/methylation domain-containing protein [Candidatus Zambryskibacteria bacterium]|nr:prepilin-type N-terminal cleavage/methylation domain-containing protein [Candidatus Zambryskibacteria bacterium]